MTAKPSYEELERRVQELEKNESELRRKEASLRKSEQKYQKLSGLLRLMCDNVPDMIWAKDLEKKYIFANRAICKNLLNATDTEETIGKTDIFFAERERMRFPDNPEWHTFGEICSDSDQITMEAGIPMQFDEFGNVQGKFLFLDVHKAPFIDADGNMIGTVGSGRDINEYKRFEKEIIFRKNIIESSSCAIATSDLEGKMTYGNTFFQQLWGFDNINDFVGKPFWELCLLEDQRDSIKETLLSGKNWSGELKAKKKDGTIFDIQVSASPVFDDARNLFALTSTSIDITERKWMENKLKRNEKLYRTLFSDSHTPIFMVDEKSRSYIDANQSALAFMECTKEQLVGRSVYENSPPENIEQTKNEHANFSEVKGLETEYLVNDKIKTLLLEVTPLELDGDRILIGIGQDITERKRAEETLRESERRLQLAQQIAKIGDFTWNVHTGEVTWSDGLYLLLGYDKPEKFNYARVNSKIHHPDDNERITKWLNDCIESGSGVLTPNEYRLIRKDNKVIYVNTIGIINRSEDQITVYATLQDITERKQAEEDRKKLQDQISQAQKAESLGRMAGAIAHHFNNQLSVVMGNLELVLDDLPDDVENREILFQSLEAGHKAAEVSQQMLRYLGHISGSQTTINLSDVCRQSLAFLQSALPSGVTLIVDFPDSGPFVHADAGQIQQVLTNLFTNAQESLPDNQCIIGLIIQTVSHEDIPTLNRFPLDWQPQDIPYTCLEISDTGCGISKEDIVKIFDPFYTTKFTGRGMGLPVTMGILKTHNGCIAVDSEAGRGSVFRVYLPVTTEIKSVKHEKVTTPKGNVGNGGTVLLIEDEETVRNMAKAMVTRLGYAVIEAQDGVEAVRLFQEHQNEIDCVLSDLTMPRMNGWETLTALRRMRADVPVILASGYDKESVMAGDHPELPQAFLNKPYSMAALKDVLMEVMRLYDNKKLGGLNFI